MFKVSIWYWTLFCRTSY